MADIGGGVIRDFSFSSAWGVNPSAASGVALLDIAGGGETNFSLGVGDYVTYSFGSIASFTGIISEVQEDQSFGQGREQRFTVVDNRLRLGYLWVFGAFNIEDDTATNYAARPSAPAAGNSSGGGGSDGLDFGAPPTTSPASGGGGTDPTAPWTQRRRFRHLLPQHWQSGLWTYTDDPLTTTQILNFCFNNPWGNFGFTRNYHSDMNDAVLTGLDYSTGIRLSNLISEINSKTGLDVRLSGSRTLVWGRKGVGSLPQKDFTCAPYSSGLSLSPNDTGVRVVGERTRIQRLNIALEPDWRGGWEDWIDEVTWRREVAATWDMPTATKSDELAVSAKARTVTVYQYAVKKADNSLLDSRPFGKISRNSLPAWVYIRELVFRSYRIPSSFSLHGVPLASLDLADSLLLATDITGEGLAAVQNYAHEPVQYYPSAQASAIVRGQTMDMITARDIRLFYRNATGDLRNEYTTAPDFQVDAVNKSIQFSVPVFIDGSPLANKSIYIKANKGEGGGEDLTAKVAAGSDYLDIVVPNPDYVITPAQIRASFCFLTGARFHKDYGSGPRLGSVNSSGLDLHLLDMTNAPSIIAAGLASFSGAAVRLPNSSGASFKELLYEDGSGVISKANALADSAIQSQSVQASGGFTRNGVVGTQLSPVVDRITVNINTSTGVTEQVEYTKSRASEAAFSERTLQRIQRTEELFTGQDALKREIRQYRLQAALERREPTSRDDSHDEMADIFRKPVGCANSNTQRVRDKNGAAPEGGWKAGQLVWLDAAGAPVAADVSGCTFGGVLVSRPSAAGGAASAPELVLAYSGRVPVMVKSGVAVNGTIYANPGSAVGGSSGRVLIGRLAHGERTPETASGSLLAMVDLGGGGGGGAGPPQLTLVDSRPSYIPVGAALAAGYKSIWVTWGFANGRLPTNWTHRLDVPATGEYTKYIYLKINFAGTSAAQALAVTTCAWETSTAPLNSPAWGANGNRPAYMYFLLGTVASGGALPAGVHIVNNGGGSIQVGEYLSQVAQNGAAGFTYQKTFSVQRFLS